MTTKKIQKNEIYIKIFIAQLKSREFYPNVKVHTYIHMGRIDERQGTTVSQCVSVY